MGVERLRVLARRVAELHVALALRSGDAAFDPEPVQAADLKRWVAAVRSEVADTLALLQQRLEALPETVRERAEEVLALRDTLLARTDALLQAAPAGIKTRIHGDLHLQQVLLRRDDFLLIDFEGEPGRPLQERRTKHSAWRDVAGMLRSFDYARHTALLHSAPSAVDLARLAPLARRWERRVREAFLQTYRDVALQGGLMQPQDDATATGLLDLFELEKALYELRYEIDNRPDWVGVPLAGILALAEASD
jgi:maltose alpha-D-glucosyltransferase/alpha-amylase